MDTRKLLPSVSCIMPTANREKYIPLALQYFLEQDYNNKELVIIDDGENSIKDLLPEDSRIKYYYFEPIGPIGTKRNFACQRANGEIIMHWDDDDWHAKDWLSKQVYHLLHSGADITGIEHVHFYSPLADTFWEGTALNKKKATWLNGATLAYWKSFWSKNPFENLQTEEDDRFLRNSGAKIYAHDYIDGFVAILHPNNTTVKYFENPAHKQKKRMINI